MKEESDRRAARDASTKAALVFWSWIADDLYRGSSFKFRARLFGGRSRSFHVFVCPDRQVVTDNARGGPDLGHADDPTVDLLPIRSKINLRPAASSLLRVPSLSIACQSRLCDKIRTEPSKLHLARVLAKRIIHY